ncbi:MAG: hypothetical protein AAGE01_09340 [Pseudomonadota bacterium]
MKAPKLIAACLLAFACQVSVANDAVGANPGAELRAFFDDYLSVYNRRFGRPERSAQFREDLGKVVRMPVLQVPPQGAPFAPESVASLGANFERFVTMLEQRGVAKLEWEEVDIHPLTANKALANNVGRGVNEAGETVYETVSLYLLHRDDEGWRISLFSPYNVDNRLLIGPEL